VAEIYFNETATAGDPKLIDKIAHTRVWLQDGAGHFRELKADKAADRLRVLVPATGSVAVVGECDYGVLSRDNQAPFLLRYYPKAVVPTPEELKHASAVGKTPVEIVATVAGDTMQFSVLHNGKPIPETELVIGDLKEGSEKLKTDVDGKLTWKAKTPGRYSVYTKVSTKTPGEKNGKKYEEIREYATLTFTWPIER
jgi:hypothetical protein